MPNMSPKKNPMPSQDPHVRNKNYLEVATGYTVEMAQDEAARCLNCKHMPCVSGCPVNVKIPDFIAKIVEGDFEGAYQVISSTNALPAISGRVLSSGEPVRKQVRPWHQDRARGHRSSGTFRCRLAS
ncbi:MAG: hypothetical protein V8T16_01830 [Parabacteroides merdae]